MASVTKKKLIDRLIGPKVTSGLACFFLNKAQLEMVNRTQKNMMARIVSWPAAAGGTWIDKWIIHRRKIGKMIEEDEEGWWSNRVLKNRLGFGGHVARHPETQAWAVMNYRDLSWWRYRQLRIRPGNQRCRHPGRYAHVNWETLFEQVLEKPENVWIPVAFEASEGYPAQSWAHIAMNRELWRRIVV